MTGRQRESLRSGASGGLVKGSPLLFHRQSEIVRFARSAIAPANYAGFRLSQPREPALGLEVTGLCAAVALRRIANRRFQVPKLL